MSALWDVPFIDRRARARDYALEKFNQSYFSRHCFCLPLFSLGPDTHDDQQKLLGYGLYIGQMRYKESRSKRCVKPRETMP
ncbi:MAG TPA: hypothetical protein VF078_03970, partial [Nitrospira sp.]